MADNDETMQILPRGMRPKLTLADETLFRGMIGYMDAEGS
jgi:hypothetical protein